MPLTADPVSAEDLAGLRSPLRHHDARALADDGELYALLARHVLEADDRVVVGVSEDRDAGGRVVLPCVRRRSAYGAVQLRSLSNYYLPDYRVLRETRDAPLAPALHSAIDATNATSARFEHLDPRAPETRALHDAFIERGWRVRTEPDSVNWTEDVSAGYDDWLARRPSRVRNTLRRRGARFAKVPGATLEVSDGAADVQRLVDAYEAVYAKSWKVAEPYRGFMPELIRTQAARGRLRLGIAWLDETPVAVQLWIVRRGVAFVYKLAHDEAGASLSAGTLLFDAVARHAIERDDVRRLDFLSGDDAYKADWMGNREVKSVLHAWRPWTLAGRAGLVRHDLGRLRQWLFATLRTRRARWADPRSAS